MVKVIVTPVVQKIGYDDVQVWEVKLNRFVVFIQRKNIENCEPRTFSGVARYEEDSLKFFGVKIPSDFQNGNFFTCQNVSVPKSWYLDQTPKPVRPRDWNQNRVVKVAHSPKNGAQQFRVQPKLWRPQKHSQQHVATVDEISVFIPDVRSFSEFPTLA